MNLMRVVMNLDKLIPWHTAPVSYFFILTINEQAHAIHTEPVKPVSGSK